jgi:hypothetical protein
MQRNKSIKSLLCFKDPKNKNDDHIIFMILLYLSLILMFSLNLQTYQPHTSCTDCYILKKVEMNRMGKDGNDSHHFDESPLSPWTLCQFEFDEDYLSNNLNNFYDLNTSNTSNISNGCRKSMYN